MVVSLRPSVGVFSSFYQQSIYGSYFQKFLLQS